MRKIVMILAAAAQFAWASAAGCNPVQRWAPGATGALLELGIRS